MQEAGGAVNKEILQYKLKTSLQILHQYEWLINSYVLDFFVDSHWEKLPNSWKSIEYIGAEKLSELLQNEVKCTVVWPLALLSLKSIFTALTISRKPNKENSFIANNKLLLQPKLQQKFEKGVKLKKRHEVNCMSQITKSVALQTGTKFIVDFGAGLGHFARILTYGFDLNVCCLEMQDALNKNACILDEKLEKSLGKNFKFENYRRPRHITMKLSNTTTPQMFLNAIQNAFDLSPKDAFTFGIVGLHPCGDLAAILIKMFLQCEQAKFLNLVGCCYMKLSQDETAAGYPLSEFLKYTTDCGSNLSYESREIACHAIEMYTDRLESANLIELKVHAYRATLEQVIRRKYPDKIHIGLRNVKQTVNLDFREYCVYATASTDIEILNEIDMQEAGENLNKWKNIVIFYSLRLFFAPLIESVILYDRMLFLLENGCDVKIEAICNPRVSPRNHITTATKKNQMIK